MIKLHKGIIIYFVIFNQLFGNFKLVKNSEDIYVIESSFENDDSILVLDDNEIGRHLVYGFKKYSLTNVTASSQINNFDPLNKQFIDDFFKKYNFKFMFIPLVEKKDFSKSMLTLAESVIFECTKYINLIEAAHNHGVILSLLSPRIIYSKEAISPISEKEWGKNINLQSIEQTVNIPILEAIKLCQAYKMEYNDDFKVYIYPELYGMVENRYLLSNSIISHVFQQFLKINLTTKKINILSDENTFVECMFLDDLVDFCLFSMKHRSNSILFLLNIGIGSGCYYSIQTIVYNIAQEFGFTGEIFFHSLKDICWYKGMKLDLYEMNNLGFFSSSMKLSESIDIQYGLKKIMSLLIKN